MSRNESWKMHPLEMAEVALQREPNHTVSGSNPVSHEIIVAQANGRLLMLLIKSSDESK